MKSSARLAVVALLLGSTIALAQSVDDAGRELRPLIYPEIRNKPYCEIFLVRKPVNPGELYADVYNSTLYNDCPKSELAAIDLAALAQQTGHVRAIANERRYWMADEYRYNRAGEKRRFGSLEMDWVALFRVPPTLAGGATLKAQPYVGAHIARDTVKTYRQGRPVIELIGPDNRVWVMQSGIDEHLTLTHLGELPDKLALPKGWSFRIRTLDKDLVMRPVDGRAEVMQDAMKNVFDACNPGVCSDE